VAAEQGVAQAQYNLAVSIHLGEGVLKDDAEAARWYRMAAEQGNAQAQANLGVMYATGEGVLKDMSSAHMWWNIAASNGNENAQSNRDKVTKKMFPSQKWKLPKIAFSKNRSRYKGYLTALHPASGGDPPRG
jgi:TPR repeat protein